jgi:glucose-6-phosphate 1-dehydrogenase
MVATIPTIIIIIGITGDLAKRKLLPAIDQLAQAGVLPEQLQIVGVTRQTDVSISDLTQEIADPTFVHDRTELFQMNLAEAGEYDRLAERLKAIEAGFGGGAQRLFYLSVPPQMSQPIIEFLGASDLSRTGQAKLLLEKPFGVDLASATELVAHIGKHFSPEQVYRIDHYLAKEMAQNIVVFREENMLFRETWNKDFIESIHITASEKIGIEGRAGFYEQTGALRDIVQSHLLQLAALMLMDAPEPKAMREVPMRRLAALRQLSLVAPIVQSVRRGQYMGYQQEVGNPGTMTETFVALDLQSDDPRWAGVPVTLATGKAMKEKQTAIRITYRQDGEREANELILSLQPNERVEVRLWAKRPGYERQVEKRSLQFDYQEDERLPEAYERVLLDAIKSDHSLFATSEEVLETWRILDPLQRAWEMSDGDDLAAYEQGSDITSL